MIAVLDLARAAEARARIGPAGGRLAATVGFFDGLHRGHRKVLDDLSSWSREAGGAPAVVTFDRHPQEVLRGVQPFIITSLRHRLVLLARAGVELTLVLRFDAQMASWSPEEFVERVLRDALGSRRLLLGFDTALGHRRRGDYAYLKAREAELGIEVRRGEPLRLGQERVSSTLVREAARAGDLVRLWELLGRPFSVLGEVARGEGRGRRLGFPTANLAPGNEPLPPPGVYFAEVEILNLPGGSETLFEVPAAPGRRHPAVVNIGRRPTFTAGEARPLLEAHLLDFSGDLYGSTLEVHLLHRHRDEMRFPGPAELTAQVARDIEARRQYRFPASSPAQRGPGSSG